MRNTPKGRRRAEKLQRRKRRQAARPSHTEGHKWPSMPPCELAELVRTFRAPCAACGGQQAYVGVWIPDDQKQVHAPPDKVRVAMYTLCATCLKDPGAIRRLEDEFIAAATAEARVN